MNHVNFLPESFIRQRAIRQRKTRHMLIVAGTVLCMAAWYIGARAQIMALRSESNQLKADIVSAMTQKSEMVKLQIEQKQLVHKVKVQSELAQSLKHSQILALLADMMPASMAMNELTMLNQRPPLRTNTEKVSKDGKPIPHPTEPNLVSIQLDGLAPDDLLIANLVGDLTEHPAFENVKMLHSKAVTVEKVQARSFRLEMVVPLARIYRDRAVAQVEEVAHAH
jgi:hypothetical protein